MSIHNFGDSYRAKLHQKQKESLKLLKSFISIANIVLDSGGVVSFEWPRHCSGWTQPLLVDFIHQRDLYVVNVDGCSVGMCNSKGESILKPWRFITSSERLANALSFLKCDKSHKHGETLRKDITNTGKYPPALCHTYLTALFSDYRRCPALPLVQKSTAMPLILRALSQQHRSHEPPSVLDSSTLVPMPAFVHKLLDRKEWQGNPQCRQAVLNEADALVAAGTWSLDTVTEKDDLIAKSKRDKSPIHMGELLQLCSIKHAELEPQCQKYKGRICYRGDNAKDEHGALAIYQEMAAHPTTIQTANANIAYGCLPGHKTTTADAIRAYVQSTLNSKHPTWVHIPREIMVK